MKSLFNIYQVMAINMLALSYTEAHLQLLSRLKKKVGMDKKRDPRISNFKFQIEQHERKTQV